MKFQKILSIVLVCQLFHICYSLPPKRNLQKQKAYFSMINEYLHKEVKLLHITYHPTTPPPPPTHGSKSKSQSKYALNQLTYENIVLRTSIKAHKELK